MKNNKLFNFIFFGGVSKQQFKKLKPIIDEENLKVWKCFSIILSVIFTGLLLVALLDKGYFSYDTSSPAYVEHAAEKFAIAYGVVDFYLVLLTIFLWCFSKKLPKVVPHLISFSNLAILTFFITTQTTLDAGNISVCVCVAFVAASLATVRTPIRNIGLIIPEITLFILMVCFGRERQVIIFKDDLVYGVAFCIVGMVFGNFFNYNRIKDFNLRIYVEEQRDIDSLTGAKSKAAYDRQVKKIVETLYQNVKLDPFALVIFDVNGLKITNDTYGHELGDELLIRSAQMIKEHFPESDVYRIGGDEFAVFVKEKDYENRNELVRKFRSKVNDIHGISKSLLEDIPIACGMATYDDKNDIDYISIFSRADTIMYDDKKMIKANNKYLKNYIRNDEER